MRKTLRRATGTVIAATAFCAMAAGPAFADTADDNPDTPISAGSGYAVVPHVMTPDTTPDSADLPAVASTDSDNPNLVSPDVTTACDQPGTETWEWSNVSKPWAITHAENYENYTSTAQTRTKTAETVDVIAASISYTSSTHVAAKDVVAELSEDVSLNLQANGSHTTTSSVSVSGTLSPNTTTVFYAGVKHVSAHYNLFKCVTPTKIVMVSAGNVSNWAVPSQGAVACNHSAPSSSLAYVVKGRNC